jgi:hypothetical protein
MFFQQAALFLDTALLERLPRSQRQPWPDAGLPGRLTNAAPPGSWAPKENY